MLIKQLDTPPASPGKIRNNELILGKHLNGTPTPNFEGIYVEYLKGDIDIKENTIKTKSHNGVELDIGRAILVGWAFTSYHINIESNIIQNTLEGIFLYHVNSDYIYVLDNTIEFTTTARDYGNYGVFAYITDVYRQFRIEENTLENYIVSIYCDHLHRCNIVLNTINISALPNHPNHNLVGIHMSNSHSNLIRENHIEMSNGLNTSPGNLYDFIGIKAHQLYNTTTIDYNEMYHTEYGLRLANDVYPSIITCNLFDHAYHGVRLVNTKHGVLSGTELIIGTPGYPANNRWYNELDPQGLRIFGTANSNNTDPIVWYYKTGTPYELDPPQWDVTPQGFFDANLTNEIFDICGQKSSPKILTLGGLSQQDFSSLSASQRDTLLITEFYHLDSLINYSSSLATLTVPTDVRAYETVRNAYLIMVNNPWILSGSATSTVNKYAAIKSYLSNTNIHTMYVLDTLANGRHPTQLNTELAAFTPQNQVEHNAAGYYTTLGNYLSNQFTLTAADSSVLLGIANQNSYTGGFAVFKARNMLRMYIIDNPPQQSAQPSLKQMFIADETESPKARFTVYPNPATDVLFVDAAGMNPHDRYFIEIYSLAGNLLVNSAIRNNALTSVDVNHLKSGFYIYRIVDNNGLMKTGKLIVR